MLATLAHFVIEERKTDRGPITIMMMTIMPREILHEARSTRQHDVTWRVLFLSSRYCSDASQLFPERQRGITGRRKKSRFERNDTTMGSAGYFSDSRNGVLYEH